MLKSDIAAKLRLPTELALVGPRIFSEFIPRFHPNTLSLALSIMMFYPIVL